MPAAKVLNDKEVRKVLAYIAIHKHAARNRAMLMMTNLSGARVKEVALLRLADVLTADGQVKDEVKLSVAQTKGRHARTLYLPEKLRKELIAYLATIDRSDLTKPLFYSQKSAHRGWSPNTLCQHFWWLYKKAGVDASSHSGRRKFITDLANKGVSVRILAELAQHRSIQTTQRYIEINPAIVRRALEMI